MARKRHKRADLGDSTASSGGARNTIPGNGGTLTPFQPGVSGNPHRGSDRFPRRNVVRAMFLVALAAEGLSVEDLRRKRKHRKGATLIPGAMIQYCKQAFKNIAIDAALGKREAYGPFLRMMFDAHAMLQPAKDEVARAQDRVPMATKFVYANDEEPAAPADGTAAAGAPPPPPPDGLLDANGQEYV